LKNKAQDKPRNFVILVEVLAKGPHEETDEQGLKKMFGAMNNWARCPDCEGFLVKIGRKFVCEKCGFSKPATPPPKIEN